MKKKIIRRGLLGILPGIAIGYLITIAGSLVWGEGHYAPCMPELVRSTGGEIQAVLLQAVLSGVLGGGFGAISVIWDLEHWSLVKQTGVYFGIASIIMIPIAYLLRWMEHSVFGVLSYFGIFVVIFGMIWAIEFFAGKHMVKKMNAHLQGTKRER